MNRARWNYLRDTIVTRALMVRATERELHKTLALSEAERTPGTCPRLGTLARALEHDRESLAAAIDTYEQEVDADLSEDRRIP